MTTDLHVIMKFGEGKRGVGWDGWMMVIMAKEGKKGGREGTRNTNHVDVKMNCCKLGRRSRRKGRRRGNEASSQGAHVHEEIDLQRFCNGNTFPL